MHRPEGHGLKGGVVTEDLRLGTGLAGFFLEAGLRLTEISTCLFWVESDPEGRGQEGSAEPQTHVALAKPERLWRPPLPENTRK